MGCTGEHGSSLRRLGSTNEVFQELIWLEWSTSSSFSEIIQPAGGWRDTRGFNKLATTVEIWGKSTACTLSLETCDVLDGDWIPFAEWTGALEADMASQYRYANRNISRAETTRLRRYVRWRWSGLSGTDQHISFRIKVTLRP